MKYPSGVKLSSEETKYRILIIDFGSYSPYGHELAHLFINSQFDFDICYWRPYYSCPPLKHKEIPFDHLSKYAAGIQRIVLPYLPPKEAIPKIFSLWAKLGFPYVLWIDHNPRTGREKSGVLLRVLRNVKTSRILKLEHGNSQNPTADKIIHPVFSSLLTDNVREDEVKRVVPVFTACLIGRIDDQKGLNRLDSIIEHLTPVLRALGYSLKLQVVGNAVKPLEVADFLDSLRTRHNIDLVHSLYGKACPTKELIDTLASSNLLLAPYQSMTASGTIALALATSIPTLVIGGNRKSPIGFENFENSSIYHIRNESDTTALFGVLRALLDPDFQRDQVHMDKLKTHRRAVLLTWTNLLDNLT